MAAPARKPTRTDGAPDGRGARADANRQRIAEAMIDLIVEGDADPSAEAVADRAGVGRRTVFRLFNDKEGVYRELHALMLARVQPILDEPLDGHDVKTRIAQAISRRARLYEEILIVKTAGDAHRYRSQFLTHEHGEFVTMMRNILRFILPADFYKDRTRFDALDLALSFEAWRRLRREQKLSPKGATAVMSLMAHSLLD